MIVAIALPLLLIAVGVAIDIAQAYRVKAQLQTVVDAAAIAVASQPLPATAKTATEVEPLLLPTAKLYVDANKLPSSIVTTDDPTISYDEVNKIVTLKVSASMPTMFMTAIKPTIDFAISADVARTKPGPMEVVIVADVTNSMSLAFGTTTRILALKKAASDLVDIVMQSDFAKIGFVPFSFYVNYGPLSAYPPWLSVPPPPPPICDVGCTTIPKCTIEYYSCVIDLVPSTCTRPICTGASAGCNCRIATFTGCITSRKDPNVSTIANPTTVPYPGINSGSCPMPLMRDLAPNTDVKAIKTYISGLQLVTNTNFIETFIPIGLVWGWNMLDPVAPYTTAKDPKVTKDGLRKAIVLITDGDNSVYPLSNGTWQKQSVTPGTTEKANTATLAACANIKAANITLYTVAVAIPSATTRQMLQDCASPGKSYSAENPQELYDIFDNITRTLLPVQVTK